MMRKITLIISTLLVLTFNFSQINSLAQTFISAGTVSGQWIKANSPYIINGDVLVHSDSLLIIESGVEIRFSGHYKFEINGTLHALGLINDSIIFTRDQPNEESRGKGIRFVNSYADTSKMYFCIVEYGLAIDNNYPAPFGGGIYIGNSNVLVENCHVRNNTAKNNGGGIYSSVSNNRISIIKNSIIENNEVEQGNYTYEGGGGIYANGYGSSFSLIANNLILNNSYSSSGAPNNEGGGGMLLDGGSVKVFNNTIYGNYSPKGSGIHTRNNFEGEIVNNIIWGNYGSANQDQIAIQTGTNPGGSIPENLDIHFNCIQDDAIIVVYRNTPENVYYSNGIGNIELNPLFIDSTNYNYYLLDNSPCINSGDPLTNNIQYPLDFDGNPRIVQDTIDIGAFEYQHIPGALVADFYANRNIGAAPSTIRFTDLSQGIPTGWEWDFNSDGVVDSYERNPDYTFIDPGIYDVTLTISDGVVQDIIVKTEYITIYPTEDWTQVYPEHSPHARWYNPMAYIGSDKVFVFGGNWESGYDWTYDSKSWIYDLSENNWEEKTPLIHPAARSLNSLVYIGSDKVLLYGGNHGEYETWIYDLGDNQWTQINTISHPGGKYAVGLAYLGDGKVLAFGGEGGTGPNSRNNETWIFDLSLQSWTQIEPKDGIIPTERGGHSMVEIGPGLALMFGGELWNYSNNYETWVFNLQDSSWTQQNPMLKPSPRRFTDMAYLGSQKTLLYSGSGGGDETWIYDYNTNSWEETFYTLNPSARYGLALAETSVSGTSNIVLFGGNDGDANDETWIFSNGESTPQTILASFIGYEPYGISPLEIQFEDLSLGNIIQWEWDFNNDGINDSFEQSPTWVYPDPGHYSVRLIVSDGIIQDTLIKSNYINAVNIIPNFTSDVTIGYAPFEVQFTDLSLGNPTNWQWDFNGDAVIDSEEQNPMWTYTVEGNYSVTLIASNEFGDTTVTKQSFIDVVPVNYVWGNIDNTATWCFDSVKVFRNVIVGNNATLTICAGTVVDFLDHYKIDVQGQLLAEGTLQDSIRFTSANINVGWHGIRFNSTPTSNDSSRLTYCIFEHGRAINDSTNDYGSGGAIFAKQFSKILISNSKFSENYATIYGGAIYLAQSSPRIQNNTICYNHSRQGAGIFMYGCNAEIISNIISNNAADNDTWYSSGGGLYLSGSSPMLMNNVICNNLSYRYGGGLYMFASYPQIKNCNIVNNISIDNLGGGLYSNGASPFLLNSIIWGNSGLQLNGSIGSISYSNVQGGYTGDGNIDIDPLFVAPSEGAGFGYDGTIADWSLLESSPCLNAGDPLTDVSNYPYDIAGNPRIIADTIDIGAYEFQYSIQTINVNLKAFLEGPFTGTIMYPLLAIMDFIPLNQPFNSPPWNYDGDESIIELPTWEIVDWVLVELRESNDGPEYATPDKILSTKAGFLLLDGSIVDVNGIGNLVFYVTTSSNDSIFAVIRHRNHLDVLSNHPIYKDESVYYYDFTDDENKVFGGDKGQKHLGNGIYGMISGDANADGQINNQDKNDDWIPGHENSGYLSGDMNMDGENAIADKNDFWLPNVGMGSKVIE